MTPSQRNICCYWAFLLLVTSLLHAGAKEDAARDLLAKSFQQANVWTQGPVQLVAKVRMPGSSHKDLNLEYTISWASPEKWRTEWSGAGYSQVTILKGGKLYRYSSLPIPPLRVLQFEAALGSLNGYAPAGPLSPAVNYEKSKIEISTRKINGSATKCVKIAWPGNTVCIDPATQRALQIEGELGVYDYGDYATDGQSEFPQSLKIKYAGENMAEATLALSRKIILAETLFDPPASSTVVEYPTCADPSKSLSPPHLDQRVQPEYPQTARQNRQQGNVWLYASVGKTGAVQQVDVIGTASPDLDKSSADAVKQWKYTPYLRCGEPAPFWSVIIVHYTLSSFGIGVP
jgi:TonB family protein